MQEPNPKSSGLFARLAKQLLGEVRAWIIAGVILGTIVWIVAFPIVERRNAGRLEVELAPVISQLEHYKVKNGKYPGQLDSLVPEYLAELPPCPASHKPGYDVDEKTGDYELFCPTFIFSVRSYTPGSKKWVLSGD